MIELRDYQLDAIERCRREVARGRKRVILLAATGAEKPSSPRKSSAALSEKGKHVLFLAHRRELVTQAARKLFDAGIDAGIVLPGFTPRPEQLVQVASIQSLTARAIRTATMDMPPADLIVVDECHHATAATYRAILAAYPGAVVLGLSATPARADGRGLGTAFDCIVECPSVADLTRMQFLVPTRVFAPAPPDLEGVKVARGDYVEAQLAERMDKPALIGDVVTHWLRHAERRRTVVFATSISHSVHIRDEFARAGIAAEHLDGSTPIDERDDILARLTSGAIDVVTNCAVLTEGWDCPAVGCVVLARPTKSLGLYRQMCGRILRPHPGKADAIILDHAGSTWAHGFIDDDIAWSLRDDRRAENKAHASRGAHKAGALVSCPECERSAFPGSAMSCMRLASPSRCRAHRSHRWRSCPDRAQGDQAQGLEPGREATVPLPAGLHRRRAWLSGRLAQAQILREIRPVAAWLRRAGTARPRGTVVGQVAPDCLR